jgi:prophage maintenance system killer protein
MTEYLEKSGELIPYDGPGKGSLGSYYLKDESLWLSQRQMSDLFGTDATSIGRHIANIYSTRELLKKPTRATVTVEQIEKSGRKVMRSVTFYNLDIVISVGYRVNSKLGTQFRIWATKVLRERFESSGRGALSEGPVSRVVNMIGALARVRELDSLETRGLLQVITDYSRALQILDDFDHQRLQPPQEPPMDVQPITYDEAMEIVDSMKQQYGESSIFGNEKDASLTSSLTTIFQTFDGKELYPSFFEKSANLLYFLSKNHSFTDGNKRIAAAIFLSFLYKNRMLHDANGGKLVNDDTLVALTLLAAESDPSDHQVIVNLIITLLRGLR